ncbi:16183_t:CDS:2 [Dentiscutata heterogama]|uniref:16183_t:CDS:1 n=1 Tax=Dentiscutata heterogama TaxID=1316150 RepID=A0ACA9LP30_9GLOM|nr:16183_t:CDS:2 [Dentiscutata heterogama]
MSDEDVNNNSIIMKYSNNFSNLQVQEFSRNTLEQLYKNICNTYVIKTKVAPSTVLDEDLGLKEAKKAVARLFANSFEDPADEKTFNRILPILHSFFHDASIHPATWPNAASVSAKICKLANMDPSWAKQPNIIDKVVNNNKSKYEMMFRGIMGEEKNNNLKKIT